MGGIISQTNRKEITWAKKAQLKYTGKVYSRWTIGNLSHRSKGKNGVYYFSCTCSCGTVKNININSIIKGQSMSCGCYAVEQAKIAITKYFNKESKTKEYRAWCNMKTRCYNKNRKQYKDWGGRGIIVCERWLGVKGFANFLIDMGKSPSKAHSLDRFPDQNGNYSKSNCRWATPKQQSQNKRGVNIIFHKGKNRSLSECSKLEQIPVETVCHRYRKGVRGVKLFLKEKMVYA